MSRADGPQAVIDRLITCSRRADITLRARCVIGNQGLPLDGGWVRLRAGRVIAVGRRPPGCAAIDLGDVLLMPGLVNAHTHLEFSTIGTPVPPQPPGGLAGWIPAVVSARRQAARSETATALLAGLRESAAAGVTLLGEIATADPVLAYPERNVPKVRVFRECLGLGPHRIEGSLAALRRGLDRLPDHAAGLSPHAPYSVHASLAKRLVDVAVRRRLPVVVHLAESREERELIEQGRGAFRQLLESIGAWPTPPPKFLSAADWISLACRAPRAAFVHASFVDDLALARLARHRRRAAVIVCPRTALLISGTIAPLRRLLDAGIRVAIGTDGRGSAPDLSPLNEARTLIDRGLISPREALEMVTTSAAWAIACEQVAGQIAPGRPANLAILRPQQHSRDPFDDAFAPTTRVVATLRGGCPIHSNVES
ncbi:MAG: amidohydrolase family protein [Pirellulales bacterium]